MPRKRWRFPLSVYNVPVIDPKDRNAIADHDLVRHVLVDFDELAVLSSETREQLIVDLVRAIHVARCGVEAGKRGVSDKALTLSVFLADVGQAMEKVGLPVTRWRKQYDDGRGESLYFRLAREVGEAAGILLPVDLKLLAKQAAQIQYGVMSPTIEAAQTAELALKGEKEAVRHAAATMLESLPLELRFAALCLPMPDATEAVAP
jgi:hypothetical protein